ncbi:MAG TPA: cell division protein FtsZ [Terrimicrobiaceae bacterium]
MIAYPRSDTSSENQEPPSVRIIGLGNAGAHLADRLQMNGHPDVVVMNTDAQSLLSSIAAKKIALGQKTTYGLGAGGDPEVGYEAAQESRDEIRSAVEGSNIIFLCAGLGGGTASGVVPILAQTARETGAVVFSIVTSPFSFEGRRRSKQAAEALALLSKQSNALIHFENDRMAELSSARSGIEETFATANSMLCACVGSLISILRGGSPMPIGLADLLAAVGGGGPAGLFGRGEATGDNRAHEALERALKSPLLDRGRLIGECHAVIAHLVGPASLSFSEVAAVMREVRRHTADDARLFLGVTTVSDADAPLSVTLFGNYSTIPQAEPKAVPAQDHAIAAVSTTVSVVPAESTPVGEGEAALETNAEQPAPAEPDVPHDPTQPGSPKTKVKQETLQFESTTRGRFDKSEPTIVEGEDLDVPTFLRTQKPD